ncbi:hypothetical protein [Novosphingobium sp.]|uniref:hypothetical protein n=1 Tax=Novosphingobium sp. TaxID=1874826 RepID=UPI00261DD931|nr:hypothetical protein [Novosphingobium sp.]
MDEIIARLGDQGFSGDEIKAILSEAANRIERSNAGMNEVVNYENIKTVFYLLAVIVFIILVSYSRY